jgi:hypothetical protein
MNREILRHKLQEKLNQKKMYRLKPNNKQLKKMKEDYSNLLKDNRITQYMLELFKNALIKYPNNKIPKPNEILDNPDHYKQEYGKYVLEIIKKAQDNKVGLSSIKLLFDNEYTEYLTHVLNIPKLPDFLK